METWKEIVAEMRRFGERHWMHLEGQSCREFSDRIEAACKTLEDVLIVEQEENAKLRRALEPVMKVDVERFITSGGCLHACEAVSEAHAIMKGGAK